MTAVAHCIQGKHIGDALVTLSNRDKKGADIIHSVVRAAKHNGTKQGLSEERMFIKTAIVGKGLSHKKIDIKGRGKHGVIRVPKSSFKLVVEEKSPADFYKMCLKGETPPAVGMIFRRLLFQNNTDFKSVASLSHMTTSRGRNYRRTQFKRLVQLVKKEY